MNYIYWDVETITSGDYTVEVDIGNDFYPKYKIEEQEKWMSKCETFCICCK